MPDPLPPLPDPSTPPSTARIRCEFCGCSLAPSGQAFHLSEQAIQYRDQKEEIRKLKEALGQIEGASETIKRDLSAAQARIVELTTPAPARNAAPGW